MVPENHEYGGICGRPLAPDQRADFLDDSLNSGTVAERQGAGLMMGGKCNAR
jgi:hypothetical protein